MLSAFCAWWGVAERCVELAPRCVPTFAVRNLLMLVAAFALSGFCLVGCAKTESAAPNPPSVEVLQVAQKDVPITKEWVATLDGFVNAQIRAQVSGVLLKQNYANGAFVRIGTPLFEIDPRPFQAALDEAAANL